MMAISFWNLWVWVATLAPSSFLNTFMATSCTSSLTALYTVPKPPAPRRQSEPSGRLQMASCSGLMRHSKEWGSCSLPTAGDSALHRPLPDHCRDG